MSAVLSPLPTEGRSFSGRLAGFARTKLWPTRWALVVNLAVLAALAAIVVNVVPWALLNATWTGTSRADCAAGGACWAFVHERWPQFVYGFYPEAQRYRVNIAFVTLAAGIAALLIPGTPGKRWIGAFMILIYPFFCAGLLLGGFAGRPFVPTDRWGGLMLTLVLAVSGITMSLPIGAALALGRRSEMPIVRWLCIGFIEFCRGVPFVTVLFMAIVMLPFFLPTGTKPNALALAVVGIIFYEAAYMGEVIRGGLQAIPKGQYEAAKAIGLGFWRMMIYIVLPQAVGKVIPGIMNTTISLLKNTTLVMVVGLFDLLNIVTAGASDPNWAGSQAEGYFVVGIVFWIMSFSLSLYSRSIETKLKKADQR